jgi:outer membrane protein
MFKGRHFDRSVILLCVSSTLKFATEPLMLTRSPVSDTTGKSDANSWGCSMPNGEGTMTLDRAHVGGRLPKALQFALMATLSSATASIAADKPAAPTVGWIVTLGAGTEYGPTFEGSGDNDFSFVPNFDIRRANEPAGLSAPDDSIDFSLIELGGLELGPAANIRGNRSNSDVPGVHDINWSVDVGAFAQYWLLENRLRVRAEARQGVQSDDGFVADFAVDWFQPLGDKFLLSAGPRASFADSTYMENSFGVSPAEALDNGSLSAFSPDAGFKSVGFVVGATYQINSKTSLLVYDKFDRLVGDAADSPIVTNIGSPNQNTIGIVLSRSFHIGF